jgi:cysteinyl-tRNA synthetase
MKWASPWGDGYPGWHIECSVMSRKYIGDTLDIHGGGMDNIFPHHECEIAQSEALTEKPFVRYFIHNNMLTVNGSKMGKSLGNFIVLKDLFTRMNPMVLRFYILQSHYRSVLDFSDESMNAAGVGFERLRNSIFALKDVKVAENDDLTAYPELDALKKEFLAAMDDDFNTPIAISVLYEILKHSNNELNKPERDNAKLEAVKRMILAFTEDILGFNWNMADGGNNETDGNREDELIKFLIEIRKQYRAEKNFAMSDKIRDTLKEIGVTLKDAPQGTTYTVS